MCPDNTLDTFSKLRHIQELQNCNKMDIVNLDKIINKFCFIFEIPIHTGISMFQILDYRGNSIFETLDQIINKNTKFSFWVKNKLILKTEFVQIFRFKLLDKKLRFLKSEFQVFQTFIEAEVLFEKLDKIYFSNN